MKPFLVLALLAGVLRAEVPPLPIRIVYENPPPAASNTVIAGTIVTEVARNFILRDETGSIYVKNPQSLPCHAGDVVRLNGYVEHLRQSLPWYQARKVEVLGKSKPCEILETAPAAIIRGDCNFRPVRFAGVITDVFEDELGPGTCWMLVEAHGAKVAVAVAAAPEDTVRLRQLVDAVVSIVGLAGPDNGFRRFLRPYVYATSKNAITTITPAPADPFSVEPFLNDAKDQLQPAQQFVHRRRVSGRVIATWQDRHLFLNTAPKRQIRVTLASGVRPPPVGATITAAGFVRKDTYFARLDNAVVRLERAQADEQEDKPVDLVPPRPLINETGTLWINPTLNGACVRLRGKVLDHAAAGAPVGRFSIACGNDVVPIEACTSVSPAIGSTVEVTGICALETETEDAHAVFCRIKGFSVVPRYPSDVRILKAPPWWTPGRLVAVIGTLLLVIGAILVWNLSLKRLSDKKGRELLAEKRAHLEAQLRIDERTRLAVELHDSLAQNLTGVSLQLDAAEMVEDHDRQVAHRHLENARHALRSCRENLRYCLGDLRSRSFEFADMTEAVLETVKPHVGKAALSVRFNVPRAILSDSSAHAVLCIVRELAVNAVRHGHADSIRIAGECRDGAIRFSVRDNGCGFDPDAHPDQAEGHFGLLGIRERLNAFRGTLRIESDRAHGTKATVTLNIP